MDSLRGNLSIKNYGASVLYVIILTMCPEVDSYLLCGCCSETEYELQELKLIIDRDRSTKNTEEKALQEKVRNIILSVYHVYQVITYEI